MGGLISWKHPGGINNVHRTKESSSGTSKENIQLDTPFFQLENREAG
jgi:hypothetical protein